ncbi:LOW QUALITY PROTEIN: putative pectinesterase/pectinesterase inhibitor 41 [Cinnamomum micranthum f. kanehirae]|uniref:Putative pectinesterase/pectinesterase inhibitor 41 n=1 Tax=Cinnamomum micranthum f. kanehirae TaxID=337451 RepID=A0A3S4PI65_9MAGN|nr:LOW QUALITY PROTEIN: putative pectinesterase/pectinesterase inhibitor 41 [Cinnamomum micranthum f. kanehirae]
MTFRNIARAAKGQALAIQNNANLSARPFTIFAMKAFKTHCVPDLGHNIIGNVTFMEQLISFFAAVFQTCNIYVRLPLQGQSNVVTAHGRGAANEGTCYSFQHCKITASPDLASAGGATKNYLRKP